MIRLIIILGLLSSSASECVLFTWDFEALKKLRSLDKQQIIEPRALSASLLKLWEDSNRDLSRLPENKFPSAHMKNSTVDGTGGDKSFYSSLVPYAFPCNMKPLGCKDYEGREHNGNCTRDGLPWVLCDGFVRYISSRSILYMMF